MRKNNVSSFHKKSSPLMKAAKLVMILLSLYFSCAMPVLTGAGLVYNRESYGGSIASTGILMILSAVLMTSGAFLCLPGKKLLDKLSVPMSASGLALCMFMLKRLTAHADSSGWTDKYTLEPISSMYCSRILPCIAPVAIAVVIAAAQIFSGDD